MGPGGARQSQVEPVRARWSQSEPGGDRQSQVGKGGARQGQVQAERDSDHNLNIIVCTTLGSSVTDFH